MVIFDADYLGPITLNDRVGRVRTPHNPLNALRVSAVKLSFIGDPIHQSKQDSRGNKS